MFISTIMDIVTLALLFVLVWYLVKKRVVNNIVSINGSLSQISAGNLDVVVTVRPNEEFASLSDGTNTAVDALKRYIAEAAARIDAELKLAKAIQHAALPSVFPPCPNRSEFDIWADMRAAKEVGGSFSSGSTGTPKGVAITHGAIANYVAPLPVNIFAHTARNRARAMLAVATVAFDFFLNDLFLTLLHGRTLVLLTRRLQRIPTKWRA